MRTLRVSPRHAAKFLRDIRPRLVVEVMRAETDTIREALRYAELLSSGAHTLAALARAGHPYSVRAPQPQAYPPEIINTQSGKFNSSWQTAAPSLAGDTITTKLFNTDPKAIYMQGTSKMVRRDIASEIYRRITVPRRQRIREAIRKASSL